MNGGDHLAAFLKGCEQPSAEETSRLKAFLQKHVTREGTLRRPLVFLTSGGTTVPLERRCVRFIDNFTTGSRGALSAEEFLERDYAVVFLTRDTSYQPFCMDIKDQNPLETITGFLECRSGSIEVKSGKETQLKELLEKWDAIETAGLLHVVQFKTIFDYLKALEWISKELGQYGNQVMCYMAAAVSDFYIPMEDMLEHKIQSSQGELKLHLQGVPKALGALRHQWAPKAFIVSFKLETDEAILITKAKGAITNYGVHAVVANLLHSRKHRVLVLGASKNRNGAEKSEIHAIVREQDDPKCIEVPLIECVTDMHTQFIHSYSSSS